MFVIFSASIEMDNSKEKTKKIIAAAAKNGIAVKFDSLKDYQTAEKIQKKAEKAGRIISRQNALYIAQLLLCDLTAASNETSKLIAYTVPGGEITREIIDKLVSKQISVSVFGLAAAITAGKRQEAFNILDELFIMRTEPVNILSALSMTYVDFYRAKTALRAGVNSENTAADFEYPYKRTFAVGKAFSAVRNITPAYLRNALRILNRADIKLKSIPVSSRIILEQAVVQLMVTKK